MTPWQSQFDINLQTLPLASANPSDGQTPVGLGVEEFTEHLARFIASNPGLHALYNHGLPESLENAIAFFYQYPALTQHLSLLAKLLPTTYYSSLFSAVAGHSIAVSLQKTPYECQMIFAAGLCHDMGFLYYPLTHGEEHLNDSFMITDAIKAHGPVAAGMILRSQGPSLLVELVRDHHERFDGTGYPAAKHLGDLHELIPILGITDLLVRIYREYAVYSEQIVAICQLILRMHARAFPAPVVATALALTRNHQSTRLKPQLLPEIHELQQQAKVLSSCLATLTEALRLQHRHQAIARHTTDWLKLHQITCCCQDLGLFTPGYGEDFAQLAETAPQDLLMISVQQNEISHQMSRLYSGLEQAVNGLSVKESSLRRQLRDLINPLRLPQLVMPTAPRQ
jgi:hypothetical protein